MIGFGPREEIETSVDWQTDRLLTGGIREDIEEDGGKETKKGRA